MAKIDVSTIEGYESMSPEEKLAALESFEYEDKSSELERVKNALTKANGEAADWKKKHNELLSEEERNRLAREEEQTRLREELEALRAERTISSHRANLLAVGYDDTLAGTSAKALVDGDFETFFKDFKKFLENHDNALTAELMKKTPEPPPGNGTDGMTLEKLRAMSPSERYEFSVKYPEEYKKLYGGN